MTYTAPEILLFIAAIGTIIVNTITAWKTGTKVEQTLVKAAVIEGHVNSKETKYVEQLASKDRELQILKDVIVEKDRISALLAQASIQRNRREDSIIANFPK